MGGYIQNRLNGKCLDSHYDKSELLECEFYKTSLGQLWRWTSQSMLRNTITGECLMYMVKPDDAHKGQMLTKITTGDCAMAQGWTLTSEGFIKNNLNGRCLCADGEPAQCSGHTLILADCNGGVVPLKYLWKFTPIKK